MHQKYLMQRNVGYLFLEKFNKYVNCDHEVECFGEHKNDILQEVQQQTVNLEADIDD